MGLAHSGGINGATYTDHTCAMGTYQALIIEIFTLTELHTNMFSSVRLRLQATLITAMTPHSASTR